MDSQVFRRRRMRAAARRVAKILVILVVAVIPAIPIWIMYGWLVAQSFSSKVIQGVVPSGLTLSNWRFLWTSVSTVYESRLSIWPFVANTLFLALGVAGLVVLVSSMGGYALSRMEFKGRLQMMEFIIALHAFPSVILLIALFILLNKLGLYGKGYMTLVGIILVKAGLEIPMASWIIKGFFDTIPWDLEWAAMVDGCSRWKVWRYVILPLVLPGIGAVSIFSFLSGWSEFLLVYTYVSNEKYFTLPVLLYYLISDLESLPQWGLLTAMGLFYTLPVLIFFSTSQKLLLRIYVGGIKR